MFGSLFIGLVLFLFSRQKETDAPYILMARCDSPETEKVVRELAAASVRKIVLKSKTVSPGQIELNYEVRLKNADTDFLNRLDALPGVSQTVLVSYNGDYMG